MGNRKNLALWIPLAFVAVILLLIAGVFAVLSQDGSNKTPTGTDAGYPAIDPLQDTSSPELVAQRAMAMIFTWNPREQASSLSAMDQALPLLTGPAAKAAGEAANPPMEPMPEWAAWARGNDQVTGAATVTNLSVKDGTAEALVTVKQVVLHPSGESTLFEQFELVVELVETAPGDWRVANFQRVSGIY